VRNFAVLDRGLRLLLTGVHKLLQKSWFVLRPRNFGAHAVALTPANRIVLVKLRYAEGWRLPGGRRRRGEAPEVAILRELREEIGMTGFASMERACDLAPKRKAELASVLVVRGVEYRRPRWSLEVEDVLEASADDLPADLAPPAERWLGAVLPAL
jgi:8-oxo-dGTP pyrophosphatase MutT (NUDIX family)